MHVVPEQVKHPVMSGVKDMHAMAGAYSARPMPNSTILATNRVLESMEVGAKPIPNKAPQPAAWVRTYKFKGGRKVEPSARLEVHLKIFLAKVYAE